MKRLVNFIFYNNGFVILILVAILSSGTVLAANEDVRGALVSSEEAVLAIDNSYIIKVNLNTFNFKVKITSVEKDDLNYYVTYEFSTIDLVDGVWQKVVKEDVLQIDKAQLGGEDLGLYAAEELDELVAATIEKLKQVQQIEKENGETNKTTERRYKGLVGRFLESDETTFAGYDPVIEPPVKVVVNVPEPQTPESVEVVDIDEVIAEPAKDDEDTTNPEESKNETSTSTASSTAPIVVPVLDTAPPVITLIGEQEIDLVLGDAYVEKGATAVDDTDGEVSAWITTDGAVDIHTAGEYQIKYESRDQAGNSALAFRTVRIAPPPLEKTATSTPAPIVPPVAASPDVVSGTTTP